MQNFNSRRAGTVSDQYLLVAAIDFGTTYSGYACSFKSTPRQPDLHEQIRTNKTWGAEVGFQSYKTPTSVLTNRTGSFISFGFEAEQKYKQGLEDHKRPDMLMFRHFKMMLNNSWCVSSSAVLKSLDGTTKPAIDIFAYAIRYLKDHLLNALKLETGSKPKPSLIRWVITVPAMWVDESKQFMRHAAFKAGCTTEINSNQLIIALEPEAASLCCRRINIAQYDGNRKISLTSGTKYLVLDCGGGTVDITMHEMQYSGMIKEPIRASGGPWGGTEVDHNFIRLLERVLGANFMSAFQTRYPQQWFQFLTHFERSKRSFKLDGKTKINIQLLSSMGSLYKEMNKGKSIDKQLKLHSKEGIGFGRGNIIIKQEAAKNLFGPVIENIVGHTRQLLCNPKAIGLKYIFMVGGFSECRMLQSAVKSNFERNGVHVLIPIEAQMAIIKGAVLLGHTPDEISSRVTQFSRYKSSQYDIDTSILDYDVTNDKSSWYDFDPTNLDVGVSYDTSYVQNVDTSNHDEESLDYYVL